MRQTEQLKLLVQIHEFLLFSLLFSAFFPSQKTGHTTMATVAVKYTKLFINNEYVNSVSGQTFSTVNPATAEEIAQVAEADAADIDIVRAFSTVVQAVMI
jgi:hypothetical protein